MSTPDLYGTFYPGMISEYLENADDFFLFKGESFDGDLVVYNNGTESAGAFQVDLYISADEIIDRNDYYLGEYNFADGIEGKSEENNHNSIPDGYEYVKTAVTLPDDNNAFWTEQEEYYIGAIIDSENAIAESNEDNNSSGIGKSYNFYNSSNLVKIEQANLPIVSFTQNENTLNIELSQPAPESGLTINYRNITKEDYINGFANTPQDDYQYSHRFLGSQVYDSELDRLYIEGGDYYDLTDYKYYDTTDGYFDPDANKYYNADGSYYDAEEQAFYDIDGNSTELIDNSTEYGDFSFSPRHYLPNGGYISLVSGIYYDARGGYIDEDSKQYFEREDRNGVGTDSVDIGDLPTLPTIATPDTDYEIVPQENIADITETTVTIASGETTGTINFNFLSDTIFDPDETIEFELLAHEQDYILGHSSLYRYADASTLLGQDYINDYIIGSIDNDAIKGLSGNDTIEGLAGNDSLNGGSDKDFLLGDTGDDVIYGEEADDFVNGGEGNDISNGGEGDDFLIGMEGDDSLDGGEGDDFLIGKEGEDSLKGGEGKDLLNGGFGKDVISGGADQDILLGMANNDTLYGNGGDDFLNGGEGIDYLTGGDGADIFALQIDVGQDFIVDFEDGVDLIGIPETASFDQLSILDVYQSSSTIIRDNASNEVIAVVEGVEPSFITEADFTTY